MSKQVIKYKGYLAKIEFSAEDMCLHGKIDGISDLVTFEADNASEIEKEFQSAVDDYLELCAEIGKEPDQAYSGTFNIRIDPSVHKRLEYYAIEHNTTLNSVVSEACDSFIKNDLLSKDGRWLQTKEQTKLIPENWNPVMLLPLQGAA